MRVDCSIARLLDCSIARLRMAICLILCQLRPFAFSFLMVALNSVVQAAEPVPAFLIKTSNRLLMEASCELNAQRAGISTRQTILLTNTSDHDLIYDSIRRSCACTEIGPGAGKIDAGSTLEIQIDVKSPPRPKQNGSGFKLTFELKGVPVFQLSATYPLSSYIGFSDAFIVAARAVGTADSYVFRAPLVVSEDLGEKPLRFRVVDDVAAASFTFNPESSVLEGKLSRIQKGKESRLRLEVCAGEGEGLVVGEAPVVIDEMEPVELLPKHLRFTKDANGDWSGSVYVKTIPPSDGSDSQLYAEVVGRDLFVSQKRMSPKMTRLNFTLKARQEVGEGDAVDRGDIAGHDEVQLQIMYRESSRVINVPVIWMGR